MLLIVHSPLDHSMKKNYYWPNSRWQGCHIPLQISFYLRRTTIDQTLKTRPCSHLDHSIQEELLLTKPPRRSCMLMFGSFFEGELLWGCTIPLGSFYLRTISDQTSKTRAMQTHLIIILEERTITRLCTPFWITKKKYYWPNFKDEDLAHSPLGHSWWRTLMRLCIRF
jgi:hypothetical protein